MKSESSLQQLEIMVTMRVKEIVILALLTTILVVQEQILALLPNIQLTFLLIFLYTRVLGVRKAVMIIVVYVFLDCLITSTLVPMTIIPMMIGWLIVPIALGTIFKKYQTSQTLAFVSLPLVATYALSFLVVQVLIIEVPFKDYIWADIPFTLLLMLSSFLTIWWLYDPLYRVLSKLHEGTVNS